MTVVDEPKRKRTGRVQTGTVSASVVPDANAKRSKSISADDIREIAKARPRAARGARNDTGRQLTEDEGVQLFDEEARRWMNMSGEDFIRRYDAGEFKHGPENPNLIRVEMLLPFARPLVNARRDQ